MNDYFQTIVVGAGLSGLTVAHKLQHNSPSHSFLVLDKAGRAGGVIKTHRENGFITEIGPHGFLDNCAESIQLLAESGLDKECVKAPLIEFVRYVFLHNRLNLIPQTPLKIIKAPLIPWKDKFRVVAELWKPPLDGEPTVAKWASHRFGPAVLPYLDAVYTGTYAGDFDKLTIDSVMPGVRKLEKEYGSVIKGLFARAKAKRKEAKSAGRKSGHGLRMPAMTSFSNGMERLVERLAEPLHQAGRIRLNSEVTAAEHTSQGWQLTVDGKTLRCRNLVLALPVNQSLKLLAPSAPEMPLSRIAETWIATVVLGFTDEVTIPPGFGFLTPEVENRFTLGALFSSNMFPKRAPDGHVVIEVLVGGRRHQERLAMDPALMMKKAKEDVMEILKIKQEPVYATTFRSDGGIPQLERDYPSLLAWREDFQKRMPSAHLLGFGWEGIGINDMIKEATRTATNLLKPQSKEEREDEVKGIYF